MQNSVRIQTCYQINKFIIQTFILNILNEVMNFHLFDSFFF